MPGVLFHMSLPKEKHKEVVDEILSHIKDSVDKDVHVGDVVIIVDDAWSEKNNLPTDIPFIVVDLETSLTAEAMLQKPLVQTDTPGEKYAVVDITQLGREETRAGVPLSAVELYLSSQNSVNIIYNHLEEFLDQSAIEEVSEIYDELDDIDEFDWDDDEEFDDPDDDDPDDHDILNEREDRDVDVLVIDENN